MINSWPLVPLTQIVKPVERPEVPLAGNAYRQVGVKLWGLGAYERGQIDGSKTRYKTLSRVEADDIIVNKIWARNGSVAVVPKGLGGCHVSGEFPTFTPVRDKLEPQWFHWITKTPFFWDQCDAKSHGTSGKNRIRPERFLEIKIPLPPLPEQRRIVARIESLAAQINEARGISCKAGEEADRLLVSMAHRRDLSDTAKANRGWRKLQLGEVMDHVDDSYPVRADETYPNLGIYSFGRGLFHKPPVDGTLTSATTLRRVRRGQFIYSRLFAFEGAYGFVSGEFDGCFVSNEYPTFECHPSQARSEFVAAYFKSPAIWKEVAAGSKGLGDRRQRVQPDKILSHTVWLPPLEWQDRIARVQAQVDALKKLQAETAAELDAMLPSILNQAFHGNL
jgi:type I restriction enzyme S subunit